MNRLEEDTCKGINLAEQIVGILDGYQPIQQREALDQANDMIKKNFQFMLDQANERCDEIRYMINQFEGNVSVPTKKQNY